MNACENTFENFINTVNDRRVIAFGSSPLLRVAARNYRELMLPEKTDFVVDNDPKIVGEKIELGGFCKEIRSVDELLRNIGSHQDADDMPVILISLHKRSGEVVSQLGEFTDLESVDYFILAEMLRNKKDAEDWYNPVMSSLSKQLIPRKIHCFWFSGEPKTELANRCIESWKRYCPDYEICEWNEGNYDVTQNDYLFSAYKAGKWAYAADYARFERLYNEGGIYLDLDLELYAPIDFLLENEFFTAFGPIREIEVASMGAVEGNELTKRILDTFSEREFPAGRELQLTDAITVYLDSVFEDCGFQINGKYQRVGGNALYPRELFSARDWVTGEETTHRNSIGMHHLAGSWRRSD